MSGGASWLAEGEPFPRHVSTRTSANFAQYSPAARTGDPRRNSGIVLVLSLTQSLDPTEVGQR